MVRYTETGMSATSRIFIIVISSVGLASILATVLFLLWQRRRRRMKPEVTPWYTQGTQPLFDQSWHQERGEVDPDEEHDMQPMLAKKT